MVSFWIGLLRGWGTCDARDEVRELEEKPQPLGGWGRTTTGTLEISGKTLRDNLGENLP